MARPRKMNTDEMLKIVNAYYESCGDASRLKCSFLEEYAVSLGFNIKAYDFRRNAGVRVRISELRDLGAFSDGVGATAYKSLDVDSLINRAKSKEALKNSLLELDEAWRRIYDRAALLTKKNSELSEQNKQMALESTMLSEQLKTFQKDYKNTVSENRYLKRMLKIYLYPTIANEILKNERVLDQIDTEIPPDTLAIFAESDMPASFSKGTLADREMFSREEALLLRIEKSVYGVDDNE